MRNATPLLCYFILLSFVGCAATAAPTADTKRKEEKKDVSCPPALVMCPQVFIPSVCTVKLGEKTVESGGSNACHARASLIAKLCKEKDGLSVATEIRCHATSE